MSKKVTKKEFTNYFDFEISMKQYEDLVDLDSCIDLSQLFRTITEKFNITHKPNERTYY